MTCRVLRVPRRALRRQPFVVSWVLQAYKKISRLKREMDLFEPQRVFARRSKPARRSARSKFQFQTWPVQARRDREVTTRRAESRQAGRWDNPMCDKDGWRPEIFSAEE